MINFGKWVVKFRIPILIVSILLLIPAGLYYLHTRVNYDILSYLPSEIDTMKGQDILLDEFGTGAFTFIITEDTNNKEVQALVNRIEQVDHVKKVLWYGSVADLSVPVEILPDDIYNMFNDPDSNSQLMMVLYDDTMGADETLNAVNEIQSMVNEQQYISGMAAVLNDIKNLSQKEVPIYVLIAVVLCLIILSLTMDSALVPVLFLLSIGIAIVYNMGTNFKGEISYVTQALAAVLQLGVTMDYSIFLWHSYQENQRRYPDDKCRAMAHAISNTFTSVVGSSITTVAGFIALCFMSFTLGLDLGIIMAKGVIFGVICCVTVLPSMILIFDKALEKTKHKVIIPNLGRIAGFVTDHYLIFFIAFFIILIPALYGYTHTSVYYDLVGTLPDTMVSKIATEKMNDEYEMGATDMILVRSDLSPKLSRQMIDEIKMVDGVTLAASLDSLAGPMIPEEMIPEDIKNELKNGDYQLMLVESEYKIASDEINAQCDEISAIIKKYDDTGMLIGEAPCTKDLIEITNTDFTTVSAVSIGVIFLIILFVFKSASLPVILVASIEFAIFINMGIPAYTHTELPFIASIVIGTIQLGSTVDYAILMTNRYKKNRYQGMEKKEAVTNALESSIQSILVSALTFFGATFGVGMYSDIDMISALCILMARGALISMCVVILVLPSMFMVFDKLICISSIGFRNKGDKNQEHKHHFLTRHRNAH
ncbi:MAG: MMPL family transporter [Lachnospiraceae bacterium]|nr:MMPL family transporter [Lachnospiraceae bacterium]